jgi:hypothetical protein
MSKVNVVPSSHLSTFDTVDRQIYIYMYILWYVILEDINHLSICVYNRFKKLVYSSFFFSLFTYIGTEHYLVLKNNNNDESAIKKK